jgi:transcriptional regulator with XRE-family HTH domain
MDYGKAIRVCRSAYGKTQAELAKALKVSPSQLSLVESGAREPTVALLTRVGRVLKVPLPLLTLLASERGDLNVDDPERQGEIKELAKSLLRLLVNATKSQKRVGNKRR